MRNRNAKHAMFGALVRLSWLVVALESLGCSASGGSGAGLDAASVQRAALDTIETRDVTRLTDPLRSVKWIENDLLEINGEFPELDHLEDEPRAPALPNDDRMIFVLTMLNSLPLDLRRMAMQTVNDPTGILEPMPAWQWVLMSSKYTNQLAILRHASDLMALPLKKTAPVQSVTRQKKALSDFTYEYLLELATAAMNLALARFDGPSLAWRIYVYKTIKDNDAFQFTYTSINLRASLLDQVPATRQIWPEWFFKKEPGTGDADLYTFRSRLDAQFMLDRWRLERVPKLEGLEGSISLSKIREITTISRYLSSFKERPESANGATHAAACQRATRYAFAMSDLSEQFTLRILETQKGPDRSNALEFWLEYPSQRNTPYTLSVLNRLVAKAKEQAQTKSTAVGALATNARKERVGDLDDFLIQLINEAEKMHRGLGAFLHGFVYDPANFRFVWTSPPPLDWLASLNPC